MERHRKREATGGALTALLLVVSACATGGAERAAIPPESRGPALQAEYYEAPRAIGIGVDLAGVEDGPALVILHPDEGTTRLAGRAELEAVDRALRSARTDRQDGARSLARAVVRELTRGEQAR
jgi:hypothetical protein